MFELTHHLAQNIVDRAMAILPNNVNVMDSQGLILGSGEANRINTRHEGAQLVLANRRIVEIDEQTALTLKGVQAGINLPLIHDGQLIGVLGISGDPKGLRTYAELVRMTAEMLVDQSHIQAEQQWRNQRRDDLLSVLLGETGGSQRLIDEAHQLGLKPQLGRTPYLLELDDPKSAAAVTDWLRTHFADSWCSLPSSHSILWCCPSSLSIDPLRLIERLKAQGWTLKRVATGVPTEDVHGLRRCCHRVAELLAYGQAVKPWKPVLSLARCRLPTLLWTHRAEDTLNELLVPLQSIAAKDANGQLIRTLRSWCELNGQPQACADALGIHRNSLRYRLERISEISGKDLTRLDDLVELYLGVQLMPSDGA
ncbi:sugar diacid recognition domain-containing protein [Pseudomonas sp. R5(2019)]|uniref:sugar diacid recognition domain-containing protein n=1 Tax=Pseudomonas sp. R5(2019) TaxID=2697566 RepID=UPI0014137839|nr:sugar diacid recognition domain-containing protein [Pseudomonas sp. R5(2019)]NBA98686.1 CdaR family transcriptional regulator [Pseudomonas sp. R5(2019)]